MSWKTITDAIGLGEGGVARSVLDRICSGLGLDLLKRTSGRHSVAFTVALISLCAKMSKADGVSSQLEAEAFEQIFHVPPEETANVERLYDIAKQNVLGFEAYADQVSDLLAEEPELKRNVLEALFHIAAADGVFHGAEEQYLKTVAERFGFSHGDYRRIRAMFVSDPDDPYTVLGVSPEASKESIKAHYRRLVRENHPDRLIAQGVPEEFVDVANRKLKAINAAYDLVARERGL